jgi:hypothetical protein
MVGCLYDGGPGCASTQDDAIEAALSSFSDLPDHELAEARANLANDGIHYFSRLLTEAVGADYVEITPQDGPCPEDDDS